MIYVFTATYHEASAWILHYGLKKDTAFSRFEVFCSQKAGIRLTVTGVGMVRAAAAVGSVCASFLPGKQDFLLNAGICAAIGAKRDRTGDLFLCHKITEAATGKTFYPDMLYRHAFCEAELVTGSVPYRTGVFDTGGGYLYDMEASAVYLAGSYYFAPHQMAFLKLVSDNGDAAVTPEKARAFMALGMDAMADYAERLLAIGRKTEPSAIWDEEAVQRLCDDMRCSVSMALSLKQHIRYGRLAGMDVTAAVRAMYQEGRLPCRTKKEGKLCFEEFKQRLL